MPENNLHAAFNSSNDFVLTMLFQSKAALTADKLNEQNDDGDTPIHLLMQKHSLGTTLTTRLDILLSIQGVDLNIQNNKGETVFYLLCTLNQKENVENLIAKDLHINPNIQAKNKNTATHIILKNGWIDICKTLIEKDLVQINIKGELGQTLLHHACKMNMTDIISLLMTKGADIQIKDNNTHTPAFAAAANNKLDAFKQIVNAENFDYAKEVSNGNTLLWNMTIMAKSDYIEQLLQLKTCNVNARNTYAEGRTAFFLACEKNMVNEVSMMLDPLLSANINIVCTTRGHTPLHIACEQGSTEIINLLLGDSRLTLKEDMYATSPLITACEAKNSEAVCTLLQSKKFIYSQTINTLQSGLGKLKPIVNPTIPLTPKMQEAIKQLQATIDDMRRNDAIEASLKKQDNSSNKINTNKTEASARAQKPNLDAMTEEEQIEYATQLSLGSINSPTKSKDNPKE